MGNKTIYNSLLLIFLSDFAENNKSDKSEWAEKYGTDLETDKVIMKRYCWCERETCPYCFDLEEEKVTQDFKEKYGMEDNRQAPNFWYKPLDFKVWWYKYIGRSMEVNKSLSVEDFEQMINDCKKI